MCAINLQRGFWQPPSIQEVLQPAAGKCSTANEFSPLKNFCVARKSGRSVCRMVFGRKVRQISGGKKKVRGWQGHKVNGEIRWKKKGFSKAIWPTLIWWTAKSSCFYRATLFPTKSLSNVFNFFRNTNKQLLKAPQIMSKYTTAVQCTHKDQDTT